VDQKTPKPKKPMIIHPVAFAMYPVVFLYAYNIKEVHISQLFLPLVLSILLAGILWTVFFFSMKRDTQKSALTTTLFLVLFFSYGHIFGVLKLLALTLSLPEPADFILIPLFLLLGLWLFFLIRKAQRNLATLTTVLNFIILGLLLYNTYNVFRFEQHKSQAVQTMNAGLEIGGAEVLEPLFQPGESLNREELPDIYYIILDEYASLSSIQKLYGYDNSAFAAELRAMGFYIAEQSRTRTQATEYSLATSLNMRPVEKSEDPYHLIRTSQVAAVLKRAGYRLVIFPIKEEGVFQQSDEVFDFSQHKKSTWINDFYMTLLKTTMLKVLYPIYIDKVYYSYYYREKTLYIFRQLEELAAARNEKAPRFVYAHIVCPHWPFVFDGEGGKVDAAHATDLKDKKYYLDQYIFISARVVQLVKYILAKSRKPPVMIIQSDHGPRGFGPGSGYYQMEVGDEWKHIFNAYYFPGGSDQGLSPTISPYNTFRLVFNRYLKTAIPLLPD